MHLTASHPPLLASIPVVLSPADYPTATPPQGMTERLRDALSSGGMARLRGLLWPSDLAAIPPAGITAPLHLLPAGPVSHLSRIADGNLPKLDALTLPETYILYHGPDDRQSLRNLLAAWSWAAASIGEYYPLLILGRDLPSHQHLTALLEESGLQETVLASACPGAGIYPAPVPGLHGCIQSGTAIRLEPDRLAGTQAGQAVGRCRIRAGRCPGGSRGLFAAREGQARPGCSLDHCSCRGGGC